MLCSVNVHGDIIFLGTPFQLTSLGMIQKRTYLTEFIGLDLLRFMLAVSVVVRHYYHFYGPFKDSPFNDFGLYISIEPFYGTLKTIYNNGHYAVQVFWLISGLIFYTIYEKEISNKYISFGKFVFLRFTRLYPLHFLMLLIVAALQVTYYKMHGEYFVYQINDLNRFFLQLFFMDAWLPTDKHSFNIPAWSVSVEVFVYLVYFLMSTANLTAGKKLWTIFLFTMLINAFDILLPFNRCLMFFFAGCILARYMMQNVSLARLLLANVAIIATITLYARLLKAHMVEEPGFMNINFVYTFRLIFVSAALVLLFIIAFRSMRSKFLISFFKVLGNMTYSIYLVHMPLQIAIFMILRPTNYNVFNSPVILGVFLASSITVGWLMYNFFEKPVQRYLRVKYETYKLRKLSINSPVA